jgi:hypothetical protein
MSTLTSFFVIAPREMWQMVVVARALPPARASGWPRDILGVRE